MLLRPHVCCCDHYHLWMETRIFRAVAIGNDIAHDINEQVGAQMEPRQQGVAHTALPKDPDVEDAYPQGEYSLNRGSRPDSYQEKINYSQMPSRKTPPSRRHTLVWPPPFRPLVKMDAGILERYSKGQIPRPEGD